MAEALEWSCRWGCDRGPVLKSASGTKVWAQELEAPRTAARAARRDLTHEDHKAFWAWAAIEVLRHTGVRIEELCELSHHSLIQYRLPTTGELVPLLQIAPSKTDQERLILVTPELADALSCIIMRVRDSKGTVASIAGYDPHERVWTRRCRCCSSIASASRTRRCTRPASGRTLPRLWPAQV
ncbi:hypothetical protein ACWFR5_13930 [Streptomyces sp. NPDC055092]